MINEWREMITWCLLILLVELTLSLLHSRRRRDFVSDIYFFTIVSQHNNITAANQ